LPTHPLAEVFGYPITNKDEEALQHQINRICPFGNRVPNCTKDKQNDPLGVCSVYDGDNVTITCPIRFRQNWMITAHAASFFFPPETKWTSLTEIRLNDKKDRSAGNIDVVLVAYDDQGKVTDFGSLEVQAVYISGNIRKPFERFMQDKSITDLDWRRERNYPRPDYLSSSRKRLAPQMIFKGGILKEWGKKQAVVVDQRFFSTLPQMAEVDKSQADIAWLIYDLILNAEKNVYELKLIRTVYTEFKASLDKITTSEAGPINRFIESIQEKLEDKLNDNPPDAPTLTDIVLS